MKLSVVIPVYHEPEKTILRAVNSIKQQNHYRHEDVEIIVALDEPERTLAIEGVKVVPTAANTGPGMARQRGEEAASGDYVSFLDADDIWYNLLALDMIVRDMENEPDYIKFPILEEQENGVVPLGLGASWCFSKVYRRGFLKEHGIAFVPEYRVHEDSYYVRLFEMYSPKTIEHGDMIYLWSNNPNSTVRTNDGVYWQASFPTYLDVIYRLAAHKGEIGLDNKDDYVYNFCFAYANISRMDDENADRSIKQLQKYVDAQDVAMLRLFMGDIAQHLRNIESIRNIPVIIPKFSFEEFIKKVVA